MKKEYRNFGKAREFVHTLKLKNTKEWVEFCKSGKLPKNIPMDAKKVYLNKGWESVGDWLGTGNIANQNRVYLPFEKAREFVQELKLNSREDWRKFSKSGKRLNDIPAGPFQVYKKTNDWISWGDWLGTGRQHTKSFLSFTEAKELVHSLEIKSQKEWNVFRKSKKRPNNIPSNPLEVYKKTNDWISWGDWLGTGRIANQNIQYRSFEEAREFVQELNFKSVKYWKQYCNSDNKPDDIPSNPNEVYKKEWVSFGDWLGTGTIAYQNIQYRSFEEAKKFIQQLGFKGRKEWEDYCRSGNKPDDIPAAPWNTYKLVKKK